MTFEPELDQALTGEEFQFLDRFLTSTAVCSDAMDIVTLQGFLAAVLSGPSLIMPSTIFPWIWDARQGTRQPRFLSAGRERKVAALIVQFWNHINNTLNHYPDLFDIRSPLRGSETKPDTLDRWCQGYCKGIDIDREAWEPLIERHPHWFSVILLLGTASGERELARREYTVQQRQSFRMMLVASALNIHLYGVQKRGNAREQGGRPEAAIRSTVHGDRGSSGKAPVSQFPVDSLGRITEEVFHPLAVSPLSTAIERDGTSVDVHIYCAGRDCRDGWILEIVDASGTSTVWDDPFVTDSAALAEANGTIERDGIASFTDGPPTHPQRH